MVKTRSASVTPRRHRRATRRYARRRTARESRGPARDGDTEQRILDAAHRVFLRHGSAGARTQEIADEAGVNKALLHYYFRSKDRLAEAVFRRAAMALLPAVVAVLASDLSLEAKVARVVAIELDVLLEHPYLPGYIIAEVTHHPERVRQMVAAMTGLQVSDIAPRILGRVAGQIRERVRGRRMRRITPDQFVINLLSLCIFPFAARPMLQAVLGLDDAGFTRFIQRRKRELPVFFLRALRP
jgi:AcrR family transcriptional regulator